MSFRFGNRPELSSGKRLRQVCGVNWAHEMSFASKEVRSEFLYGPGYKIDEPSPISEQEKLRNAVVEVNYMAYDSGVRIAKSVALKCAIEISKVIKNMSQDTAEAVVDYFSEKYFKWLIEDNATVALSQYSEANAEF